MQDRRPDEVEARPWRDYKPEPEKGTPIMAPGGWLVLATVIGSAIAYGVAGHLFRPIVSRWVDALLGY